MTLFHEAIQLLKKDEQVKNWPLLGESFERAANRPPIAWDFPIRACRAVGGTGEAAIPAVAAITCAHMALILIDDILDSDPRGLWQQVGSGRAANLATALNAICIRALMHSSCLEVTKAVEVATELMQVTAYGQDLDVQNLGTEESYWAVTRAKSSPYFGAALYMGALLGDADPATAERLKEFGHVFGEIMQLHDDLNDCLAAPANVDWLQGRAPLPILYAQRVDHPDRQRFLALRNRVQDPEALREAQAILVSSGAIAYCVHELMARVESASLLLKQMRLKDPAAISQLLEQTLAPVKHLFAIVGVEFENINR